MTAVFKKAMRPRAPLALLAVAVCLLAGSTRVALPGDPKPAPAAAPAAKWPKAESAWIPMRDGQRLAADVWIPPGEGPYPAVLVQTPYGRTHFAPEGAIDGMDYAFVCVDWRGFFGSKDAGSGIAANMKRGTDGYDCVEWVAKEPWCNGKVGTWGPSALGIQQFKTAQEKPPHLACCVPVVASMAWRYETFHPGGVLRKEYAETLDKIGFAGVSALVASHPLDDAFWHAFAAGAKPERIDVPCLMIGGWFDLHPDEMIDDFRALRERGGEHGRGEHRLLIGPWTHHFAASYVTDAGELPYKPTVSLAREETRRWFDRWLRGAAPGPAWNIKYFALGEDVWKTAASWPSAKTTEVALYPADNGALSFSAASPEATDLSFLHIPEGPVPTVGGANLNPLLTAGPHDQRPLVLTRRDVLSYETAILEEPMRVEGRVVARLFVDCEGPDADVHVRLCDEFPDGRAMLMADGARRLSLRESFAERSKIVPRAIYPLDVVLPDLAVTFAKGHRIVVAISGSNFPRYEVQPARASVGLSRMPDHPSRIVLPTVPASAR